MQAQIEHEYPTPRLNRERTWPLDARMAMFVLEAGGAGPTFTRHRSVPRHACRIMGTLCNDDPKSLTHSIVYVRDISDGNLGFISQHNLPIGQTVWLNCTVNEGAPVRTPCRIGRSRAFMKGWHEGVLHLTVER
jgi:PilZ domain